MLVRLTHTQFRQVELRMPELYATTMREHRVTRGRTQHDYDMPAIAWRHILDQMMRVCFGPAGGKLKGAGRPADSAYLAIRRVADAVRRIEGHPALRGSAVEGWVGDVVPAWQPMPRHFPEVMRRPYPTFDIPTRQPWTFVLLVPQHEENLGMQVTRWSLGDVAALRLWWEALGDGSWTFLPESHLLFSRAPTAGAPA